MLPIIRTSFSSAVADPLLGRCMKISVISGWRFLCPSCLKCIMTLRRAWFHKRNYVKLFICALVMFSAAASVISLQIRWIKHLLPWETQLGRTIISILSRLSLYCVMTIRNSRMTRNSLRHLFRETFIICAQETLSSDIWKTTGTKHQSRLRITPSSILCRRTATWVLNGGICLEVAGVRFKKHIFILSETWRLLRTTQKWATILLW